MLSSLTDALTYATTPEALLWVLIGAMLGVVFGAIPGLGGGMLMALLLPLTFGMESLDAQILLISIYVGGVSGSLTSAILLGVPGSPAAVMTTLDGHALANKGRAAEALSIAIMASFIGGLISWIVLVLFAIPLASAATQFRNFDYFAFIMLGLILIAFTGGDSPLKGILSGFLGVLLATVGFDAISASNRFTFGVAELANGFDILPVLIGSFAVRQILEDMGRNKRPPPQTTATTLDVIRYLGKAFRHKVNLLRSSILGSWIGVLPGIGANIGAVITYTIAETISPEKDKFGKGSTDAIVAAESGNNATVGGALVPMIALGIPGSGQDVILLAALVLHHIEPGPLLAMDHPDVFYGIIIAYLFANIAMFAIMILFLRWIAKVITTPSYILAPLVLMFCVVGVVATNNRLEDAWVMFGFGVLGVMMGYARLPLAPFVIGFVLGPMAEVRLRSALMGTGGEVAPLLSHPVAMICLIIAVVAIVFKARMVPEKARARHE